MTPPPSGLANAAGSLRQEMAAASSICQISPARCQACTRLYRDGELEGFPVADISDYLAEGFVTIWLTCVAELGEDDGALRVAVGVLILPSSISQMPVRGAFTASP